MFGIEIIEFFSFVKQVGFALVGAAGLWGFVFSTMHSHGTRKKTCIVYHWLAERIVLALMVGFFLAVTSWLVLIFVFPVYAHEGIVIPAQHGDVMKAMELTTPLFYIWVLATIALLVWQKFQTETFHHFLGIFFITQFCFSFFLMSLSVWTGEFSLEQLFFAGHSNHSILTVGTVLILDYLFLISAKSFLLKQHVYPLFPLFSKVIWVGLGLEFFSVSLVFAQAIELTHKFYFMQLVVVVLMINGTLLAGPITRRLLASISEKGIQMGRTWMNIASVAGTVSIVSWLSITFIDFFPGLVFTFFEYLVIYVVLIMGAFLAHMALERFQKEHSIV
jgi:hypothetical protein